MNNFSEQELRKVDENNKRRAAAGELDIADDEAMDILSEKKPVRFHLALIGIMWMNKHVNKLRGCDEDGRPLEKT